MKIILLLLLSFYALFALSLTPEEKQFLKEHPIIKVSNETDWPPFDFNENGQPKGYSIDYLNLLAKKIGIKFQFETHKWSELVQKIKNKEIDIIHPLGKNKKREAFLTFTKPHIDLQFSIVTRSEQKGISSLNDLKNRTVAVVDGWNTTLFLKTHYPEIIFKSYPSAKAKLEAVAFGEVDATIEGYFTTNYLIQKHILSNLKIVAKVKDERLNQNLYIGIRKDWSLLKNILQKAMISVTSEDLIVLNIKWIKVQPQEKKKLSFSKEELAYLKTKQSIKMCTDPDWMPYEKNDKGKHIGMSSDYFKIFKKLIPKTIEYVPTKTWAQTLQYAKQRKCDIISLAVQTPLRSEYLNFTSAYLKLPLVIATDITQPFIIDIQDVLDKKIGVVKGHAYIEIIKNRYPQMNIIEVNSLEEGFDKILDGELYGFLDSLASTGYDIQRQYLGNIKIAGKLDLELEIGVATRNDEFLLNAIFEKAVQSLEPSTHREILNKWVAVKYEEPLDKTFVVELAMLVIIVTLFFAYRQNVLKRQNEMLKESNEEFGHLINSTIEALLVLENGKYVDVNNECISLLGAKNKEEIIGLSPYDIIDSGDHKLIDESLQLNNTEPFEAHAVKRDGTVFPVLIKGHNFSFRNRKIRIAGIIDMTELKSKERLLLEQTKMAALGEMLGNIAHQWRQPLSVISTAASGMKVQKSYNMLTDELFEEFNDAIMTNVDYLSNTIDDFKNFIKEDKVSKEFNLKEHVQKDLTILTPMLKNNGIHIESKIDESIVLNNLENELTQAIVNIVSNAKDAFIENSISDRIIFISAQKSEEKVILSIKDNAGGIPDEVINRIFEPYFTTKHKSQGTGLGLFMTRKIIVQSMNGQLDVQNEPCEYKGEMYKGANFRLTL